MVELEIAMFAILALLELTEPNDDLRKGSNTRFHVKRSRLRSIQPDLHVTDIDRYSVLRETEVCP